MDNDINSAAPGASENAPQEQGGATEGTPVGVRVKSDAPNAEASALQPAEVLDAEAETAGSETAEPLPEPGIVVEEGSSSAPRSRKKAKGGLSGGLVFYLILLVAVPLLCGALGLSAGGALLVFAGMLLPLGIAGLMLLFKSSRRNYTYSRAFGEFFEYFFYFLFRYGLRLVYEILLDAVFHSDSDHSSGSRSSGRSSGFGGGRSGGGSFSGGGAARR